MPPHEPEKVRVADESEVRLVELRDQLDVVLAAGDADRTCDLMATVGELLDNSAHLTWDAVVRSKINKTAGELEKNPLNGDARLQRCATELVRKLRKLADTSRLGGSCLEEGLEKRRVEKLQGEYIPPPPKLKSAAVDVAVDVAWHPLPDRRTVWEEGTDGEPQCVEVPDSDHRWRALVGESSKPRVQGRVSVVVPTIEERRQFHGQIWLCYHSQTYEDKELIVVDSCDTPSPIFESFSLSTPDIKYINVDRSMSIGEKRNLAIREHSTGEIIANFDDDDLYFPAYLVTMVKALQASKSAVTHLSAWNVLDLQADFCATFNSSLKRPSEDESFALAELSGFSMVYTHAAWRSVPWPPWSLREDRALLRAAAAAGLPVSTRVEAGRALTVLHVQHGRNMQRSVCNVVRKDGKAIVSMIHRFEDACRRIMNITLKDYQESGTGLLHPKLRAAKLVSDPPSAPIGVFPLLDGDSAAEDEGSGTVVERCRTWLAAPGGAGVRPDRENLLCEQRAWRQGVAPAAPC